MKARKARKARKALFSILTLLMLIGIHINAENAEALPRSLERSGPRVGVNVFYGDLADGMKKQDRPPINTLFGWQFEHALTAGSGDDNDNLAVVFEGIPIIGGLEQNMLAPSFSFIVGLRTASGFEVGVGPTFVFPTYIFDLNEPMGDFHSSVTIGAGWSFKAGQFNLPINLALMPGLQPGQKGLRTIFIIGANWF